MIFFKAPFFGSLLLVCSLPALAFDYLQPLPEQPPIPADNPQSSQKIALGKRLFFDTRLLGADSKISCNSCHNLKEGGDDNRALSLGQDGKTSQRSAPSLWNIGFQTVLYWDGRAISLEAQTLDHLRDPVISRWPHIGALVDHLNQSASYQRAFRNAFPDDKNTFNGISGVNIARAISSFERSLLARNSPFDRYIAGDKSALSASAQRGIQAFNDAGCLACHFGANFAGPAPGPALKMGDGFYELFPNNLGSDYEQRYGLVKDLGRFEFTGNPDGRFMWRVPPLRGIALTAPYFHNGSVASLEEAIRVMGKVQFNKNLSAKDVRDISAFLHSLTGELEQVSPNQERHTNEAPK
ncbi:MAG: c-type cytochrome [Gammaproteobacteria bacterium]|nr:c-type cytochrome [Gammaproteobacteria bacterium]MCF6261501.1 c-type cytochrome [Gammaproteobacteria bacterium]